jgi:hypothetical protein
MTSFTPTASMLHPTTASYDAFDVNYCTNRRDLLWTEPRYLYNHDAAEHPEHIKNAKKKWIKWVESALHFDDVPTGVKNLKLTLQELGDEC